MAKATSVVGTCRARDSPLIRCANLWLAGFFGFLRRLGICGRFSLFLRRGLVLVANEMTRHGVDVYFVDAALASRLHVEAVDQLSIFALEFAGLDFRTRD